MHLLKLLLILALSILPCNGDDDDPVFTLVRPATASSSRPARDPKPVKLAGVGLQVGSNVYDRDALVGHGGPYGALKELASLEGLIESDHAPHYSILEYINKDKMPADLPQNVKDVVETRKQLLDELHANKEYTDAVSKLDDVNGEKSFIQEEAKKHLGKKGKENKTWLKRVQPEYKKNIQEMTALIEKTVVLQEKLDKRPGDPAIQTKIKQNENDISKLVEKTSKLLPELGDSTKRLVTVERDRFLSERKMTSLQSDLRSFNSKVQNEMGTLSIPSEIHKIFPSTGKNGLTNDIAELKGKDAGAAKIKMEEVYNEWVAKMQNGMGEGHLKNQDNLQFKKDANGNIDPGDPENKQKLQKIYEENFNAVVTAVDEEKEVKKAKRPAKDKKLTPEAQKVKEKYDKQRAAKRQKLSSTQADFLKDLHGSYSRKFMTSAIYHIKSPGGGGYNKLMSLYIAEYKLYLGADFDSYKMGIQKLLETNKQFGWIDDGDIKELSNKFKLDKIPDPAGDASRMNKWNEMEDLIRQKSAKMGVTDMDVDPDPVATTSLCSTSATRRRKRGAAAGGCVCGCCDCVSRKDQRNEGDAEDEKRKNMHDLEDDDGNKKKIGADMDEADNPKTKPDVGEPDDGKGRRPLPGEDNDPNSKKSKVDSDDIGVEEGRRKVRTTAGDGDIDILPRPRVPLPLDSDTSSINSKRLNSYLSQMSDGDIDSVRVKESFVEHTSRNLDKLTGTHEEIAKTKALIKHENLDAHSQQNELARKVLRTDGDIPPKSLSKYQKVKVSASKLAAKASKFTSGSEKVSGSYGKIMLAKGVVTALRHGDYESLALMGGRIGLDIGIKAVAKLGRYIVKKSTTKVLTSMAKKMKFLGKIAGPIGDVADIGMNIYSITKSVKRLNDPNASKFDQNDAIADIVADAIDIAVTATAAVLSLAFPPLAPVFAAVAFIVNILTTLVVAFYKAANHVDRLNSELPLLDYERTTEYWRYVGGRDTSGYIQELIDTKKANNIAVNMTVQFLISNPDYIGRIFPSKTMYDPEADCFLQMQRCGKLIHFIPIGCQSWEHLSDCDGPGGYCEGGYSDWKCQSDSGTGVVVPLGGHEDVEYRCHCGSDPPPVWGYYDILDNEVDFRNKRDVYLQRAAPDFSVPSGFSYKCKPSSLTNEGDRVSNRYTSYSYLCKGAIGVTRSGSGGKFMLYDLGKGRDTVRLDESERVDNLFVVKDGRKDFEGNGGDDTFMFDGPCDAMTGRFDGKRFKDQGNSIVLGQNCSRRNTIEVDLGSGFLKFAPGRESSHLSNIHRVIGRKDERDLIILDCSTKLVVGGGGASSSQPDYIRVPSCGSSLELTVSVEGSTTLDAVGFTGGKLFILLRDRLDFLAKVPRSFGGTVLFKFENSVGRLTSATIDVGASTLSMGFSNGGRSRFQFSGGESTPGKRIACEPPKPTGNQISILLHENSNFSRQFSYDLGRGLVQCLYRLNRAASNEGAPVYGYDFMDNVFHLMSGFWKVFGGRANNQFILVSSEFEGEIDGRSGQNSLRFGNESRERLEINLDAGYIQGRRKSHVRNIQSIFGRPEFTEIVTASSSTRLFDLGGTAHDFVEVPSSSNINLTVIATGKLSIVDRKLGGVVTIQGGYQDKAVEEGCFITTTPSLDLFISILGRGETTLLLNFPSHTLLKASIQQLSIDGGNEVKLNGTFPSIYFEEENELKSVVVEEGGKLLAFHELSIGQERRNLRKERRGSNALPNVFKMVRGTNWKVVGGSHDDTFSLEGDSFQGEVDGGLGRNSLYIGDDLKGKVEIGEGVVAVEGRSSLTIQNMAELHGRAGEAEEVQIDCGFQYVGMNGGRDGQNYDLISIPQLDCDPKMTIVATGFTKLLSVAERGNYDIYVKSGPSNDLKFQAEFLVTSGTVFNLPIKYPSYKLRSYELEIDENSKATRLRLKLDNDNFVEYFQKFGVPGSSSILSHPVTAMFVDEEFSSGGNIIINWASQELSILHVLQDHPGRVTNAPKTRRGATGAKNIFRLHTGNWEAFGGTLDDAFLLNDKTFTGKINGLGGVNALILTESLNVSDIVTVNLAKGTLSWGEDTTNPHPPSISLHSIQTVVGRKLLADRVVCDCDTRLVMLEGGASPESPDVIEVQESFCQPQSSFVIGVFTQVVNNATGGNFTYHVRTSKNFDIQYKLTNLSSHHFKLEMDLGQIKNISLVGGSVLEIEFENGRNSFPLNFQNLPTFQIIQSPELMADLIILENNRTLQSSIIARSPFNGSILGVNGVENGIVVQTSSSIQSVIGGDKDDTIFLHQVKSILVLDGRDGSNRLQLGEELHKGRRLEVDFSKEIVSFLEDEDDTPFVNVMKGITLFTGRKDGFEKVILGCDTSNVRYGDEIIISSNCGYDVRIEVGEGTRVIFEIENEAQEEPDIFDIYGSESDPDDSESETSTAESLTLEEEPAEESPSDEESFPNDAPLDPLEPSTFHYHFSSIQSFDIEIESFPQLRLTRHIFYLNFTLSDLASLRFSIDDSRLIYQTFHDTQLEYSHLVGELDETSMFYSQPEFMTAEGFLLRISRYGEIIAVIANPEETLELEVIQQSIVPRLSAYASQLGISFMIETGSAFIDCGNPTEFGILTNRNNATSHLLGFDLTTYDILGLDADVFIYPQNVQNDSYHVLDLTDIIFQIRAKTEHKYVPVVTQVGSNLEILMNGWTDLFPGKVALVNGTSYYGNIAIMLNSIAMEILPVPPPQSQAVHSNRSKRSADEPELEWVIKPRPITIPEGHVYLFSAEDLEDTVEIRREGGEDNSSFEYSKENNDLVVTSITPTNLETGRSTSFIIFDYYSPATQAISNNTSTHKLNESLNDDVQNQFISFGNVNTVNNISIRLGNETVMVSSNQPLILEETGEELRVEFYEDILDREEAKLSEGFPDLPRKFKVSWIKKIGRTREYRNMAKGIFWASIVLLGILVWKYCRKKPKKGKYSVMSRRKTFTHSNGFGMPICDKLELKELQEFYEEDLEDFTEPKTILEIRLLETSME